MIKALAIAAFFALLLITVAFAKATHAKVAPTMQAHADKTTHLVSEIAQEVQMKAALLSLALLGDQPLVLVSDRVPHLNVEALCKATVADDKANGIVLGQSFEKCMSDETAAQQKLTTFWQANPGPERNRCEAEATVDENQSNVDLLTCIQMTDFVNAPSDAPSLREQARTEMRNRLELGDTSHLECQSFMFCPFS